VGVDDRRDDGQAEAGAATPALAPGLRAPEALEQRLGVTGGQPRTVVADLEAHLAVHVLQAHLDRRPLRRVDERVAQQVAQHLAQLVAVAEHQRRAVDLDADLASRGGGAPVVDGVADQRCEVEFRVRRLGHLVEAGEGQQVLDQHPHPCRFVLDASHRLLHVGGVARGAHAEQLGVAPDGSQRGPQLVRGVGDEAAQAVLAGFALAEGPLEAVEHRVERDAQPADLGPRVGRLDAVGEVAAGDRAGRVAHAIERQQADAHDRPRDEAEDDEDGGDHERLDAEQAPQGVVGGAQRDRRDGDAPVHRVAHGQRAVARTGALLPVDGEGLVRRHLRGQRRLGRHGAVDRERLGDEHPAARVALLAVGPGRDAEVRGAAAARRVVVGVAVVPGRAADLLVELTTDPDDRGAQLLVDSVVLERALLDVGDPADQQQSAGREGQDGHEQPRPQRGHHVRGWRSA
jgi:hypothetical protein